MPNLRPLVLELVSDSVERRRAAAELLRGLGVDLPLILQAPYPEVVTAHATIDCFADPLRYPDLYLKACDASGWAWGRMTLAWGCDGVAPLINREREEVELERQRRRREAMREPDHIAAIRYAVMTVAKLPLEEVAEFHAQALQCLRNAVTAYASDGAEHRHNAKARVQRATRVWEKHHGYGGRLVGNTQRALLGLVECRWKDVDQWTEDSEGHRTRLADHCLRILFPTEDDPVWKAVADDLWQQMGGYASTSVTAPVKGSRPPCRPCWIGGVTRSR